MEMAMNYKVVSGSNLRMLEAKNDPDCFSTAIIPGGA